MTMRICTLEIDILRPQLIEQYHGYGRMFRQLLEKQSIPAQFDVFNVVEGCYPDAAQGYDAYLITGSKADSFGTAPWIQTLREFLLERYDNGDRLIGICFGHQLRAVLLASSPFCPNAAYRIGDQVLCFQAHPEFVDDYELGLLNLRREFLGEARYQQALASMSQPHQGVLVVEWMLRFAGQQRAQNSLAA